MIQQAALGRAMAGSG